MTYLNKLRVVLTNQSISFVNVCVTNNTSHEDAKSSAQLQEVAWIIWVKRKLQVIKVFCVVTSILWMVKLRRGQLVYFAFW